MEKNQVQCLCSIRDLYKTIAEFEVGFQKKFEISLNEGMILCTLESGNLSSSDLAEKLGISNSNASKVIRSVENKGLIHRILGEKDKRQMYFTLTTDGAGRLKTIKEGKIEIPDRLKSIIEAK